MIFRTTSKKPIVLAGSGVRAAGGAEILHAFYEKTKIPVLTTMNAVDLMQDKDKLGFIGVYGHRVANLIVSQCDLIISVGARLGLRQIGDQNEHFAMNASLIRADIDPAELNRTIKENEEKHLMDAKSFLEALMEEEIPVYEDWNRRCFEAKEMLAPYDKEPGNRCIERIAELLPENALVAVDVGQAQCWTAQDLTLKGNQGRILIGGGYGSMGCGLPYAIGGCIAAGRRKMFCITGDGGLQMNIQELQTVASERLPIKIFVINNKVLGKIAEIQATTYEGRFLITTGHSGYTVPDFEKVAAAYGIRSCTVDRKSRLREYASWMEDDEPCLINVLLPVDTHLLPKMNWDEGEMAPMLRDELMEEVKALLR